MNNKGFAITTILYGTLIIFLMLLISMLGILSIYRNNLEKLIESNNGARDMVTMKPKMVSSYDEATERGLYCISNDDCKYITN